MLQLYVKTGCPYSAEVRKKLTDEAIDFVEYNIHDPLCKEELLQKGGKTQTPFLIDTKRGIGLYDSNAIIAYLQETYCEPNLSPAHQ